MLALTSTMTATPTVTVSSPSSASSAVSAEADPILSKLTFELSGEVFARARATRDEDGDFDKSYALTRARLNLTVRYAELLRLTIEPDFASALCSSIGSICNDAELSDAFFEVSPIDELDVRIGQAKTPFGVLETTSVWRLPAQRRGLVNDLVADRLGFGGRKLGVKARARFKEVTWKPSIELGAYSDPNRDAAEDFVLRAIVRPWKNGEVQLQGYAENDALSAGGVASSGAIAVLHETKKIFATGELLLGHARLLTLTGDAGVDSTFLGARVLAAYAVRLDEEKRFELEPYLGADAFDPNLSTKDDLGGEIRGGLNFFFLRMFRVNLEISRRAGQTAFPEPRATVLSLLLGASLG